MNVRKYFPFFVSLFFFFSLFPLFSSDLLNENRFGEYLSKILPGENNPEPSPYTIIVSLRGITYSQFPDPKKRLEKISIGNVSGFFVLLNSLYEIHNQKLEPFSPLHSFYRISKEIPGSKFLNPFGLLSESIRFSEPVCSLESCPDPKTKSLRILNLPGPSLNPSLNYFLLSHYLQSKTGKSEKERLQENFGFSEDFSPKIGNGRENLITMNQFINLLNYLTVENPDSTTLDFPGFFWNRSFEKRISYHPNFPGTGLFFYEHPENQRNHFLRTSIAPDHTAFLFANPESKLIFFFHSPFSDISSAEKILTRFINDFYPANAYSFQDELNSFEKDPSDSISGYYIDSQTKPGFFSKLRNLSQYVYIWRESDDTISIKSKWQKYGFQEEEEFKETKQFIWENLNRNKWLYLNTDESGAVSQLVFSGITRGTLIKMENPFQDRNLYIFGFFSLYFAFIVCIFLINFLYKFQHSQIINTIQIQIFLLGFMMCSFQFSLIFLYFQGKFENEYIYPDFSIFPYNIFIYPVLVGFLFLPFICYRFFRLFQNRMFEFPRMIKYSIFFLISVLYYFWIFDSKIIDEFNF